MKKIASLVAAAVLAACGQSYNPDTNTAGKGDTEMTDDGRVIWSGGQRTRGTYDWAGTDRLPVSYVDRLTAAGELPSLNPASQPEFYYSISVYNWGYDWNENSGSIPFFVTPEEQPFKLAGDAFALQLADTKIRGDRPASSFSLYLFKFHNIDGVEGYTAVSMGLDEAMAGKVVTGEDEVGYARGMIAALQQSNGPDRVGFAGTWKAVVVPDYRAPSETEQRVGTREVDLGSLRLLAVPTTPALSIDRMPAGLAETHQQVSTALATRNFELANQFVLAECGVFEFFNPGAMTAMVNHAALSDELDGMRWGMFDNPGTEPQLAAMAPHFSCEADDFTKTGCFATPLTGYNQISETQKMIDQWITMEQTSADQMAKLQRCDSYVSMSVSTAVTFGESYILNYGQVSGQWYLISIDGVTPCDA